MSDSLISIAKLSSDPDFIARCAAAIATQPVAVDSRQWAHRWSMELAASPGFGAAYESALVSGVPNPGADASVISDQQILAAVQHSINEGRL